MSLPLNNRIALVSGASRGIGYAAAIELAKRGAHVVATARTTGGLEELDDAIKAAGGTATLVPVDLKDTAGIARLADALRERYGRLDILVGNAAQLNVSTPLTHIEPKEWDDVLAVNVTANWHLIRYFEPLLKASDAGRIVMVTSAAAGNPQAYFGLYSMSKVALEAITRSYAAETANTPLRVNLFSPGRTHTAMQFKAFPGVDPAILNKPEDVAVKLADMCMPSFTGTGQLYDYPQGRILTHRKPD